MVKKKHNVIFRNTKIHIYPILRQKVKILLARQFFDETHRLYVHQIACLQATQVINIVSMKDQR